MTTYIDSEPSVVVGEEAIFKNAIERDIFMLIHSFAKASKKVLTFGTFASVWKEYDFSLIHFGCPDQKGRPYFMQAINEAILEHFRISNVSVRLGVIFSLYLMYFSQPDIWPREPIRVTQETWEPFYDFVQECSRNRELSDGYSAFSKLVDDNAFKFCALPTVTTQTVYDLKRYYETQTVDDYLRQVRRSHSEKNISSYLDEDKLYHLEMLSQKYMDAKKDLFYTRHGTLAAQKLMNDLANIQESNPTHLRRVLQSSSLGNGDEEFMAATKELVARYEEARFNSVVNQHAKPPTE